MDVTLTPFGGPGAPCTLLHSDALDVRIVLDCGATPIAVARPSSSPPSSSSSSSRRGFLALHAPDVRALVASAPPSRRDDACPFADAVLISSPAALLALPLLYRAAADEQQRRRRQQQTGGAGEEQQQQQQEELLPPLPLHTYATDVCLEIAEQWIAELLDAERRAGPQAKDEAANGDNRAGGSATAPPTTAPTTPTTPLFSARDARRALSCVRPVHLGERLTLPGGGRVVACAVPASGARVGVCAWRLGVGATESLACVGPCASSLRGHAHTPRLDRAMEGARVIVLGPGAVDQRQALASAAAGGDGDEDEEAAAALLFAPGRPRPPLLEQGLRSDSDPADVRHAVAVHRAARAALDAVRAAGRGAQGGEGTGASSAAAAATVAVDPTGAGFDFLEALEYEVRYPPGVGGAAGEGGSGDDDQEEEEEEEEEEEGQLRQRRGRRRRRRPDLASGGAAAAPEPPPLRVLYAGPAAEDSLALGTSAADYLSPGRQHKVVRRAAAPFAHSRMLVGDDGGGGGGGGGEGGQARAAVEVRVEHGGGGKQEPQPPPDILIVPAARVLAGLATQGRLILLGTAAHADAAGAGMGPTMPTPLRFPLPGERGVPPAALAATLAVAGIHPSSSTTKVVVAVASEEDARALRGAPAWPGEAAAAAAVVYGTGAEGARTACALPLVLSPPNPLYDTWLAGPLAARAVLTPLPRAPGRPGGLSARAAAAARLPPVRLSLEGGGGGGAWRVDEEEEEEEEEEHKGGGGNGADVEAAVVDALRRGGFEVLGRRLEQEEQRSDDEGSGGGGSGAAVIVLSVAAAAEVRLALATAPRAVRSVLVLSEDAAVRQRLRHCCEEGLRLAIV